MKHETLEAALVAALAEMPAVGFDATNHSLKNKYASLGAMIKTSQPVLAKHGLGVIQPVKTDEVGRIGIETTLIWEGGKSISTVAYLPLNLDAKSVAQDAGSSITYLRRYSLAAMLGMYADEDTDGNQPPAKAQPEQPRVELQHDVEPKMALATAEAHQRPLDDIPQGEQTAGGIALHGQSKDNRRYRDGCQHQGVREGGGDDANAHRGESLR